MALTILFAASSKFSAEISFNPELSNIVFPSLKFVPANLTTKGTLILISFAASTTPWARTSHLMMPPKILIKIPLTFLSDKIILKAAETFSFEAPPPTSRKFAGSSPYNFIISIVAIAKPAPFTIQCI